MGSLQSRPSVEFRTSGLLPRFDNTYIQIFFRNECNYLHKYINIFEGELLLRIGFGKAVDYLTGNKKADWQSELKLAGAKKQFEVRVHIYQGKNLPISDSNGLCDPFIEGAYYSAI